MVAVDVAENRTQTLVTVRLAERLAVVRGEPTTAPIESGKPSGAVVEKKLVRLAVLKHLAVDELDPAGERPAHSELAVDVDDVEFAAVLQHGLGTVVDHVQVKIAVAVDVSQRERAAAEACADAGGCGDVGELAVAVVSKKPVRLPHGRDEQVEIAVSIDIRKRRPTGKLGGTRRAGGGGGVLKLPVAKVAVHHVAAIEPTEVNVATPVIVIVAQRHTGTVEKVLVGDQD